MSVTRAQILAEIPDDLFRQALYAGGAEVAGKLDQLIANAEQDAGAGDLTGQRILVCDAIYRLARIETAKNPFAARAAGLRERGALAAAKSSGGAYIEEPRLNFDPDNQEGI